MTLSAPSAQTPREPQGRPVEPPFRRSARIVEMCPVRRRLMFRAWLVPRRFAQFGIFGGSLALVAAEDGRHTGVNGPLIPALAAPVAAGS